MKNLILIILLFLLCGCKFIEGLLEGKDAPICCALGPEYQVIFLTDNEIHVGDTVLLNTKFIDFETQDTIQNINISWSSNNDNVIQVIDSNQLVAISTGTANLTETIIYRDTSFYTDTTITSIRRIIVKSFLTKY